MRFRKIPPVTIQRLSLYYRALLESRGSGFISSDEIAHAIGSTAAQVRRDLAYFGQFGTPGRGYQIDSLKGSILKILGMDRAWSAALIGVGNLGSALLSYKGFLKQGFKIVSCFDSDPRKIGRSVKGSIIKVKDMKKLESEIKKKKIDIAILTVPQDAAQGVIDRLVKAKVKAILNFAPVRPRVPSGVEVLNVDLSIELERLAYFLTGSRK